MNNEIDSILKEILRIIEDNLYLLVLNDNYLVDLKWFCKEGIPLELSQYCNLLYFVDEALRDLLHTELYDFKGIE